MNGPHAPRRVLVWQWGRFGAGPRIAVLLTEGLRALPDVQVMLSLSQQAEILRGTAPPACDLPVATYQGLMGFALRALAAPLAVRALTMRLRSLKPDLAICALPGPLDLVMATALRRMGVPFVVVIHDADPHPGDGSWAQMWLQRRLCRAATWIACLSAHVGDRLRAQGLVRNGLIRLSHPPMGFDVPSPVPHGGPMRLLHFGRLLPYKGLDLLAEALALVGPRPDMIVRVAGFGPESPELDALRTLSNVTVENRWVPENEVGLLLAWSDALVLPYREASQSGVAAAALAAGRAVVATRVGGLGEQLGHAARAVLCEPTAQDLARALRDLVERPPAPCTAAPEPKNAWRDMAASLMDQVSAARR
jgi:glycosyltransferase involved in cell wall biosynthesis